LKLVASTVAEISRGPKFLLMLPLPDLRQFWYKTSFFGKLVPSPSCVPNLKLLASTVAEICRESDIFGCFPSPAPSNFGPKRCFWKATPVPKWCKNFVSHVHVWRRQQCVLWEKAIFVQQNLGIFRDNGVKGSKFLVENVIFGIADPDLPIHYATFMGLRWWLRVVYSWELTQCWRYRAACDKNLAIANRSRVSCAHTTLMAFVGLNITPWPWNLN